MLDRPQGGDRALLVEIDFGNGDLAERLDELKSLALSAGATVTEVITRAPARSRRSRRGVRRAAPTS